MIFFKIATHFITRGSVLVYVTDAHNDRNSETFAMVIIQYIDVNV